MNVIILTGSTGGGHNRAAKALSQYFLSREPDSKVDVIDAIEECSALLNFTVVNGYKALVRLTPSLFGALYKTADKQSPVSDLINVVYSQCGKKLLPIIEERHPDVVISCHPFAAGILAYMKKKMNYSVPLMSIVTDFMPHRTYIAEGIDAFVTASEEAKDILVNTYGIESDRVYDYGHPVFDQFYEHQGRNREEVLDELGLEKDKLTVLIMAGSFGVTDILKIYEKLLDIDVDYQMIVITGRNKRLFDAFEKMLGNEDEFETDEEPEFIRSLSEDSVIRAMYNRGELMKEKLTSTFRRSTDKKKPTKLFYFVDNVDDYMHASDLIVTKPGGLTTSESIACALPMAVFKAYPGQEEQNAQLLVDKGIGIIIEKSTAGEQVGALLTDRAQIDAMRECCRKYVRKNSCENIYELARRMSK